jgi:hypothetical protein
LVGVREQIFEHEAKFFDAANRHVGVGEHD